MNKYCVYVDRTGLLYIEATTPEEAREKAMSMTIEELERNTDFSKYDIGDADLIED